MIDWIKFSERQPEEDGVYLCLTNGFPKVLGWELKRNGFYERQYLTPDVANPDYWAEINLPGAKKPDNHKPNEEIIALLKKADELCLGQFCVASLWSKESPMPEKPLCKDCRWLTADHIGRQDHEHALCGHSKAFHSPVDGEPIQQCNDVRNDGSLGFTATQQMKRPEVCGPDGKWFEAKEGICQNP